MKHLITVLFLFVSINLIAVAQTRKDNVNKLYETLVKHKVENPEIVLAISVVETGWFECDNCSLDKNNYFGFMTSKGYLTFSNMEESVKYMKRWQDKYYIPYITKNPGKNFYDFLKYIGYAGDKKYMDYYNEYLKRIQKDISPMLMVKQ